MRGRVSGRFSTTASRSSGSTSRPLTVEEPAVSSIAEVGSWCAPADGTCSARSAAASAVNLSARTVIRGDVALDGVVVDPFDDHGVLHAELDPQPRPVDAHVGADGPRV